MWYMKELLSDNDVHFVVEGTRSDESISIILSLYENGNHYYITEFTKTFKPIQLLNITDNEIFDKFADKAIKISNKLSNKTINELLEYFKSKVKK